MLPVSRSEAYAPDTLTYYASRSVQCLYHLRPRHTTVTTLRFRPGHKSSPSRARFAAPDAILSSTCLLPNSSSSVSLSLTKSLMLPVPRSEACAPDTLTYHTSRSVQRLYHLRSRRAH